MLSLRCDVFTESLSWNQSPVSYGSDSKRLLQMVCANIQCWLEFYICDVFRVKRSEAISTVVLYSVFVSLRFFYFIGVFRCLSVYECVCIVSMFHFCHSLLPRLMCNMIVYSHLLTQCQPFKEQRCQLVTLGHPGQTYIFNFWHSGTLALMAERQSARMSEIKNLVDLVRPGWYWTLSNVTVWHHCTLKG